MTLLSRLDVDDLLVWADKRPAPVRLVPRPDVPVVCRCEGCDVQAPCWLVDDVFFCIGCREWYRALPPQGSA